MTDDTETEFVESVRIDRAGLWGKGGRVMRWLDVELTERCNHNCVHCTINRARDDQAARREELSTERIKEILEEAAGLGCLKVRFTGGEPLLRDDFEELYLFARRLGMTVLIFTNATLVTPQLAQCLARVPPMEKIEITVYGMSRKSYEAVTRSPGSFDQAFAGMRLLLEHNVPFIVKAALLPANLHEIDEFERWATSLPGMDGPPSYSLFFDLRGRRDSEAKNRVIEKQRMDPEQGLDFLMRDAESEAEQMKAFCRRFMGPRGDVLFECGAGLDGGCVDAYGKFQMCLNLRHPDLVYDLNEGSLKEALIRFFPKMRETRADNVAYRKRCGRCFLKGLCEQCPAKSWMEHGTLDTPVAYLCAIAHQRAKRLGLLREGEKAWEVTDWRARIEAYAGSGKADAILDEEEQS